MLKLSRTFFPFFMMLAVSPMAQAEWADPRACELPHQILEAKCRAADSISAVQKKKSAAELLAEYRRRSNERTEMVAQANEEYRAYFSRKR